MFKTISLHKRRKMIFFSGIQSLFNLLKFGKVNWICNLSDLVHDKVFQSNLQTTRMKLTAIRIRQGDLELFSTFLKLRSA